MRAKFILLVSIISVLFSLSAQASRVSVGTKHGRQWSPIKSIEITAEGLNLIAENKDFNCTIDNDFIKGLNVTSIDLTYTIKKHELDIQCDLVGFWHLYAIKMVPLD
jgi:hypothetical protein